jgi:hypothetical protein
VLSRAVVPCEPKNRQVTPRGSGGPSGRRTDVTMRPPSRTPSDASTITSPPTVSKTASTPSYARSRSRSSQGPR